MSDQPRLTVFGKLIALLVIGGCLAGAYVLFTRNRPGGSAPAAAPDSAQAPAPSSAGGSTPAPAPSSAPSIEIGIAYGSEKERWFTWAADEFMRSPAGAGIKINLKKLGSIESAQAILKDDTSIHVWSPASRLYEHTLLDDWQLKHGGESPVVRSELLAFTPMVFVMWEERAQAFEKRFSREGGLNFKTIAAAFATKGGWSEIADPPRPEWGFFKFGHTHPNQSNSGLMTLVLMAYDYHDKTTGLSMADITNSKFQEWTTTLQRGVTGMSNSTGNMMKEMVQRGPSTYDALFVYENTAVDYLANAEGRWGRLRIVYPAKNAWNDNPYYVLNVPWSTSRHRDAAQKFLDFLLSEPSQQRALTHGFRPGNVQVPINGPESPFVKFKEYGLRIDLPTVCDVPSGEVIRNLLIRWQQTKGG